MVGSPIEVKGENESSKRGEMGDDSWLERVPLKEHVVYINPPRRKGSASSAIPSTCTHRSSNLSLFSHITPGEYSSGFCVCSNHLLVAINEHQHHQHVHILYAVTAPAAAVTRRATFVCSLCSLSSKYPYMHSPLRPIFPLRLLDLRT